MRAASCGILLTYIPTHHLHPSAPCLAACRGNLASAAHLSPRHPRPSSIAIRRSRLRYERPFTKTFRRLTSSLLEHIQSGQALGHEEDGSSHVSYLDLPVHEEARKGRDVLGTYAGAFSHGDVGWRLLLCRGFAESYVSVDDSVGRRVVQVWPRHVAADPRAISSWFGSYSPGNGGVVVNLGGLTPNSDC